jgi:glycosyltransferase involved in cell wall biosynthesis
MPKKLLFVVHRYAPYPGGSEYNVQRLAEEALRQGHDVTVLSDTHCGDLNGVKVTSDRTILVDPANRWDMIFVHGSCSTQDVVHHNAEIISSISPIYYLIVEPPKNAVCWEKGMKYAKWIGIGTEADWDFVDGKGFADKAAQFFYGIDSAATGQPGFKASIGIPDTDIMYLSVGGFWPHKRHSELAEVFRQVNPPNTHLVLMGYDNQHGRAPTSSENVHVFMDAAPHDIYDAMFESDLYILNSESEGYGLVLLEAMLNCTPWIATDIAAAHDLGHLGYGITYTTPDELAALLQTPPVPTPREILEARELVMTMHSIENSVKTLLSVLD